jgi:hypothetical protein
VQFDTFGSAIDSLLLFGSGESLRDFRTIAENDDSSAPGAGSTSRVRVLVTSGTTYRISVSTFGSGGAFKLNWSKVNFTPSVISFSGVSYSVGESNATRTVTFTRTLGSDNDAVSAEFFTDEDSGTALSFTDYDPVSDHDHLWRRRDHCQRSDPIRQDRLIEGTEVVPLRLLSPSETANIGVGKAALRILDDEPSSMSGGLSRLD